MIHSRQSCSALVQKGLALALSFLSLTPLSWAQQEAIAPEKPTGSAFIRPYKAAIIPPARLANSTRFRDLIRGGKLYLTAQDAIALALENNIDLELERYTPIIDAWNLERAEAGGSLPGVPSASSQAGSVVSGQGVSGSQAAAGVSTTGTNQSQGNAVGATISQIGPVTPLLDPLFQSTDTWSHRSTPQPNVIVSGVINLAQNTRNYSASVNQGLITGGQVSLSYRDAYLNENAPTDVLNPSNGTVLQLSLQHNFLQGFGTAVNSRNITIAKANLKVDDLNFKSEVIGTVVNVLNLYYGLVADYQDLKARQSALEVAQNFFENNKKQVQVGTMAPLDVTTAEAQVASSQQDLVNSQTTLEEQQLQLKNALSRNGLADPLLREVQIIPLDRIVVPEQDNLPPMKDLIATARANRVDIAAEQLGLVNSQTSALGTENSILPQLAGLLSATTQGLSGTSQPVVIRFQQQVQNTVSSLPPGIGLCPAYLQPPGGKLLCEFPDPYFVGNIGTALGQNIRRNFPSQRAGGFIAPVLRNRQAQADFAVDQLSIRQSQLQNTKDNNQIAVDVSNQVIGLQQARVRYLAAVKNRVLEQQLLEAEQKKFALGASTSFNVVQQQRDLATAQSTEIASLVTYSNARVAFYQTLGTTLEENHISVKEALNGRIARPSSLPANLPTESAATGLP